MLTDLALVILAGLFSRVLSRKTGIPYILLMLGVGVLLGPFVFDALDEKILGISHDLKEMALTIILLKAGLSLDIKDLKKVGLVAVLLCIVPATLEIIAFIMFAPSFFDISRVEAGLIGTIIAAISPAIIVPYMIKCNDEGYGVKKSIPQMLMAAASANDIYVIVLFSALIGVMNSGDAVSVSSFIGVPVAIVTGIAFGGLVGVLAVKIFNYFHMRDTAKVLLLLSISFLFEALEKKLAGTISFSGLLAVMSMGVAIDWFYPEMTSRLYEKFAKIWVASEIMLFVLVGAEVNLGYVAKAGFASVIVLSIGLVWRFIGAYLCTIKTNLNNKERLFTIFAQIPKATVQAAIGGVPLAMGLACGDIALSVSVISIIITAPLGTFLLDYSYKRLLTKDSVETNIKETT